MTNQNEKTQPGVQNEPGQKQKGADVTSNPPTAWRTSAQLRTEAGHTPSKGRVQMQAAARELTL